MTNLHRSMLTAAAAIALLPASAQAATLVVDVANTQSVGDFGDPGNVVRTFQIGAGAHVTGIAYAVSLTAFTPSYLSELALAFTPTGDQDAGLFLRPAFQQAEPGSGSFADSLDLTTLDLDFLVGADGLLRLEFFEGFDDLPGADGIWNSGTVTVTYAAAVPEPATWALMAAGFGLVGGALRRRATVRSAVRFG